MLCFNPRILDKRMNYSCMETYCGQCSNDQLQQSRFIAKKNVQNKMKQKKTGKKQKETKINRKKQKERDKTSF